ncbi:hypothetical protein C1645_474133 [Glomus cerebriforme]|uniref:L domain-like protein n=1 Tax=Glomus cerebriforme TaxID=658196 RepID=A0A397SA67_9GLOM|nr:hypothetical protein C1645_474133 [Glomus cerebriforme]
MVNAQEWLDRNYPKETRSNIIELNISKAYNTPVNEYLNGSLKLEGFINLKELDCCRNNITSLDVDDNINLKKLKCSSNKLSVLKFEKLSKLKELGCESNQLIELNLNPCKNLENLNCYGNKLTNLKINNLTKLESLRCNYNKLTNLDLSNCPSLSEVNCCNNKLKGIKLPLENEKLEKLDLNNNNFSNQDLSIFGRFINLKELDIGNDECNGRKYNRFYGSLEPLKTLTKLRTLEINNTDIENGLEYLSDSVEEVGCSTSIRKQCGVKKIQEKLSTFVSFDDDCYFTCKLKLWKEMNKLEERNNQLQKNFEEERSICISLQKQINNYFQTNLQLQNDLQQVNKEKQQLQQTLSNIQLQNLTQQLISSQSEINQQSSVFEEEKRQLQKQIEELKKILDDAQKKSTDSHSLQKEELDSFEVISQEGLE